MTVAQMVGDNLRVARKAKGLTQQQVAAAMNKYQSDYSDYERGLIQLDYDKIIFLCKMLDITPNDLFAVWQPLSRQRMFIIQKAPFLKEVLSDIEMLEVREYELDASWKREVHTRTPSSHYLLISFKVRWRSRSASFFNMLSFLS